MQIAGAAACAWLAWRGRANAALVVLAGAGLVFAQLALSGHESLSKANSAYYIVQKIKPELKPGMPFYSVDTYDQSLQFYLRRTTTMVSYKDELGFGIAQEPQKFIPTVAQFEKNWDAEHEALALMSPQRYDELRAQGLPMRLVARDTRRVIVARDLAGEAMNVVSFSLLMLGVFLNATAQLLLKAGTNAVGQFDFNAGNIVPVGMKLALEPHIMGGMACYVVSLVVWIMGLSRVEVSIAYPMLSIGYVLNAVAAWYLFGEAVSATRLAGIGVIIVGVYIVARS